MKQLGLAPPAAAVALLLGLTGCGGDLTLPDPPATGLRLVVLQGNGQNGTVGQQLQDPVVVGLETDAGVPLPGRLVVFVPTGSTTGTFDPDTALTDAQGKARTYWSLGTAPGPYTGEASLIPPSDSAKPVAFGAAATAGAPDSVRAGSATLQSGHRGEPVDEPPTVVVVDRYGNPVSGVAVSWHVETGNGELSPAEGTVTDAAGRSSVTWTLGSRIGVQQATAEVQAVIGSPVTFWATVSF